MNKKKFILSYLFATIIVLLNINFVFGQWELIQLPENVSAGELYFDSTDVYLGTGDGIYVSHDNCESWEFLGLNNYMVRAIIVTSDNKLIVGATGKIFKYLGNQEWQMLYVLNNDIECAIEANNGYLFFGCWGSICRSTDGGETWNIVLAKGNTEAFYNIKENNNGVLFAGSTAYTGSNPGGFYRSENEGESWQLVGLEYHYISSLEINSLDDIFVGTRGHWQYSGGRIFKSLDPMGNSWEIKLENNLIADMDINDYNTLFIGCSAEGYPGGVFCSYDNGDTWNDLSSGLPTRYIEKVFISPDNILYVVTYATNRLYRFNDPITDNFCEKVEQVKVYPNPANNNIYLKGSIPYNACYAQIFSAGGHVMMDFELTGNRIGIENLEKGIYYLVLINSNQRYVSKFIKY